jgi:CspA family cold shock protein
MSWRFFSQHRMDFDMIGTISNWLDEKAYGFIKRDDNQPDVFCHITGLAGGVTELTAGDRVQFEIGEGRNGKSKAVDVRRLDGGTDSRAPRYGEF